MGSAKTTKVVIQGMSYHIATGESESYVRGLARELDEQMTAIFEKNKTLSLTDVMVLCMMNYADAYKRSEEAADRMRTQVQEYLEESAKARIELDDAKKELFALRHRLEEKELTIKDLREKESRKSQAEPKSGGTH